MRPGELTERASMSKQAMNYRLAQLKARDDIKNVAWKKEVVAASLLSKRDWQVRKITRN